VRALAGTLRAPSRFRTFGILAGVFAVLWLVAIALQVRASAYKSEFDGYPDEPSHYVTGLMVRDYIAQGLPAPPLAYAKDYYLHYPKIGLGHWPPLFYAAEGMWMLLFSGSRTSVLIWMALCAAALASLLTWRLRRRFGWTAALCAGILLILLPPVQEQTEMVMIELLLAIFAFLAAASFGDYMRTERWQDAARFGLFVLLDILTKGNAWALILLPPIALLLSRKLYLIGKPAFWAGPAIIALCLPVQLLTFSLAHEGWTGGALDDYALVALRGFTADLIHAGGIPLFCLAALGIAASCLIPIWRREPVSAEPASMLALLLAVVLFHSLVPAGIEMRKLVMALPALVFFVVLGAQSLNRRLGQMSPHAPVITVAALAVIFAITGFSIPKKQPCEVSSVVAALERRPEFQNAVFLVSGDSTFEGVFISECAMREKRPDHIILRATKLLADANWNESSYRLRFQTPTALMQYIDGLPIGIIAVQPQANIPWMAHHAILLRGLAMDTKEWEPLKVLNSTSTSGAPIGIRLYRRTHAISTETARARIEQVPSMEASWMAP